MKKAATPQPAPSPIATWLDTLSTALRVLKSPEAALPSPPAAEASLEHARALIEARHLLGVRDEDIRPAQEAGKRLANRAASNYVREGIESRILDLSLDIDKAIAQCLEALSPVECLSIGVIRSDWFLDLFPMSVNMPQGEQPLYAGRIDILDPAHPLHNHKPEIGWFLAERRHVGQFPVLLLGAPAVRLVGASAARPFYSLQTALLLTANFRGPQVRAEEQRAIDLKNEEKARQRQWLESPLGQLDSRLQELERIKGLPAGTLTAQRDSLVSTMNS